MQNVPEITFSDDFPLALRTEVEDLLAPFVFLVRELRTVQVALKGASAEVDGEAAIRVLRRYHTAHLWLDPDFWSLPFEEKERTILHELFHIVTNTYTREIHRLLTSEGYEEDSFVADVLEDAEETLVDRLAWDFYDVLTAQRKMDRLQKVRPPKESSK